MMIVRARDREYMDKLTREAQYAWGKWLATRDLLYWVLFERAMHVLAEYRQALLIRSEWKAETAE